MLEQRPSRRQFLQGSVAAAAGALLMPRDSLNAALPLARAASQTAPITGATVNPSVYGITSWPQAAQMFDSYVGFPLASTIQKIYMLEGQFYTDPLPVRIHSLARIGCQFIICVYPSRNTDDRANLAAFLRLLNSNGIVYQVVLDNEWNVQNMFASGQDYLDYWSHYAPVVKAAGVPLCSLVCASSNRVAYSKVQPGFPVDPLPDGYWIDYYATAYRWNLRLDAPGGLLQQAESLGVPVGIGEFGIGANSASVPMSTWSEFCSYLATLAPRLQLGCLYWGCKVKGDQNVVTGPSDPKVPGIKQVISAFKA